MDGFSVLAWRSRLASGEATPEDVARHYLEAIAARDPEIHAFLLVREEAREEARNLRVEDRQTLPFFGIPVALKDNFLTRGVRTTAGSRILETYVPPVDATAWKHLALGGAVLLGKTNLDEFAMGVSTETSAFGPTRNPWDLTRTAGGSSGGSAAAVAAGFTPLALGSDTGGSVRQPAAYTGIVGFKPTYGLISRFGLIHMAASLDTVGVLANTVADAAYTFVHISGSDHKDPTSFGKLPPAFANQLAEIQRLAYPARVERLHALLSRGFSGVKVALVREFLGDGVSPDVRIAIEAAARRMEELGAHVEVVSIPELKLASAVYAVVMTAEAASYLGRFDGVRFGLRVPAGDVDTLSTWTRSQGFGWEVKRRILFGTYVTLSESFVDLYERALRARRFLAIRLEALFADYDLLLGPTTPTTAPALGAAGDLDPVVELTQDLLTIPANLAGLPAVSVPAGRGSDGMPVGLQIVGPRYSDLDVLAFAFSWEEARPLEARPPFGGKIMELSSREGGNE
ncbi:amidase [Brockia lithotrophica]|uniref:Glutamyl-tRNA(Gln) amidotransferase subunit A n=1 Tax=Brockia lithotrophica TaxID=933949 RepID=A0A660KUS2_9BACL|nr:amidase family protein [Brockia lithotrophica]RKQ84733.1 aspartyl/glutamyl-tRNA(Asn/Gln) amidotransferase subunit A [Brockia lithotrophica]